MLLTIKEKISEWGGSSHSEQIMFFDPSMMKERSKNNVLTRIKESGFDLEKIVRREERIQRDRGGGN
jgi:Holliday junction resolvase